MTEDEVLPWDRRLDDLPDDYFTTFPKVTLNPPEKADDYGTNPVTD